MSTPALGPHLHVPTPGETVSEHSGSALVTVAKALADCQRRRGGDARLVVRDAVDHGDSGHSLIRVPLGDKVWTTRSEKLLDLAVGSVTGHAPRTEALWRPIYDAVGAIEDSYTFLHNSPAAAAGLRGTRTTPVAYLHNEVLRGWPAWRRRRLHEQTPVVAVSPFIARRAFGERAMADGRVLALINGVDTAAFRPGTQEVEPTILFVGKVAPHKGPHLLVAAARMLAEEGVSFRLLIVGASVLSATDHLSPYEVELRRAASALGNRVEFLPFTERHDLPEVYRRGSIMVVPSAWDEPCALTLGEGMATGLACVSSARGGLPDAGGDAVLYFAPDDVAGLANQLRALLSDDQYRSEMGERARARAVAHSWDRQFETMTAWLADWKPA